MGQDATANLFYGFIIDGHNYDDEPLTQWLENYFENSEEMWTLALGVKKPKEAWTEENADTVYRTYWEACRTACTESGIEQDTCGYSEEPDVAIYIVESTINTCGYGNVKVDLEKLVAARSDKWDDMLKRYIELMKVPGKMDVGWHIAAAFG